MRKTELAVGASPNAQIVAKLPVIKVVPAPVAWLGVSRHLVPFQTLMACHLSDQVHHGVSIVIFWQHRRVFGKQGIGLDGEMVNRNVGWLETQCCFNILPQLEQGLTGQGVHQIQIEGFKG